MALQPDDPGPRSGADHDRAEHDRVHRGRVTGAPADAATDPDLPEGMGSPEPVWVLPSIVLGLVALSGSVLLFAALVIIGTVLWLLNAPPVEHGRETFGQQWPGPFGGPGLLR